jgi:hypothetical protein
VLSSTSRYDGGVTGKHEMKPGIGNKICLKFVDVDVQTAIESKGCGEGAYDLSDKAIEVCICWLLNMETIPTDVINRFIIENDTDVDVL